MRNIAALALGLLVMGLGIYGAAAVAPMAFPAAFDVRGYTTNTLALLVMLAIAEVFTMFAGWVTARLVTDHLPGHAVMMSIIGLAVAVFVGTVRWSAAPAWYYLVSWALMPVSGAIGAYAWERSLRRKGGRSVAARVATS
jgi:hypothetical protein